MEYDKESFMAGFAVGRLLWRPPSAEELTAILTLAGISPSENLPEQEAGEEDNESG